MIQTLRGYPVCVRSVAVAGQAYNIFAPANYEQLIDEPAVIQRFRRDEYLPYWAEFWPAALLLAEEVAQWPPVAAGAAGPAVLELGCGLGLIGLVAARRGYAVTVSDYDEDALAFVLASARHNGIPPPQTRLVDWRRSYPDLRPEWIVAADVLYERRSLEPIAAFLKTHLHAAGAALLCDANRAPADDFAAVAAAAGLAVTITSAEHPRAGPGDRRLQGRIFRVRHR